MPFSSVHGFDACYHSIITDNIFFFFVFTDLKVPVTEVWFLKKKIRSEVQDDPIDFNWAGLIFTVFLD